MGRLRVFLALLSLLVLPGCVGLFGWFSGGNTATLTGTVRLEIPLGAEDAPVEGARAPLAGASAGRVLPASAQDAFDPPSSPPVELLLYAGRLSRAEAAELAGRAGFEYLRSSERGYHVLRDLRGRSESGAIRDLEDAYPGARIEPNRPLSLLAANDPLYNQQWALAMIRAEAAWEAVSWRADDPVVVAIVDTGIDFSHPDLADSDLWLTGLDLTDPRDDHGVEYGPGVGDAASKAADHGTMVAGVIAALTGNGIGVAGAAGPGARVQLMPLRVFGDGTIREETLARAIDWAVEKQVDVINLSLGYTACVTECPRPGSELQRALDRAFREGVVVVAAAGNNGGAVVLPANHPTVIAVGALAGSGARAPYSAFGDELDLVAPGGQGREDNCKLNVIGLRVGGSYGCDAAGTSFAAPHVAGVLALMIARYRALGLNYGPDDLRVILELTATDLAGAGWDEQTGYGLVNAHAAVTAGVPQIFVGSSSAGVLEAASAPARAQPGRVFRLTGVPEGTWTLFAWVDADASGTVNAGDYFQEYGQVNVTKRQVLTGIHLVLTRYEGEELAVEW